MTLTEHLAQVATLHAKKHEFSRMMNILQAAERSKILTLDLKFGQVPYVSEEAIGDAPDLHLTINYTVDPENPPKFELERSKSGSGWYTPVPIIANLEDSCVATAVLKKEASEETFRRDTYFDIDRSERFLGSGSSRQQEFERLLKRKTFGDKSEEDNLPLIFNTACSSHDIEFWDSYNSNSHMWPIHQKMDYIAKALDAYFTAKGMETSRINLGEEFDRAEEERLSLVNELKGEIERNSSELDKVNKNNLGLDDVRGLTAYTAGLAEVDASLNALVASQGARPIFDTEMDNFASLSRAVSIFGSERMKGIEAYVKGMIKAAEDDRAEKVFRRISLQYDEVAKLLEKTPEFADEFKARSEHYSKLASE